MSFEIRTKVRIVSEIMAVITVDVVVITGVHFHLFTLGSDSVILYKKN